MSLLPIGYFYHNHKNDPKYWRDLDGGWKKQGSYADPILKEKRKNQSILPRVRNGRIFPISARKTHTVEEILAAKEQRRQDNKAWIQKPKKKRKKLELWKNVHFPIMNFTKIFNKCLKYKYLVLGIGIYFLWRDRCVIFWDQENFENTLEHLSYNVAVEL